MPPSKAKLWEFVLNDPMTVAAPMAVYLPRFHEKDELIRLSGSYRADTPA